MPKNARTITPGATEAPQQPQKERGWLAGTVYRPRFVIALAVVASLAVFGSRIARLLPNLSQQSQFRVQASHIVIPDPPVWVPRDFLKQVIDGAGLPENLSLLDEGLAERLAKAFRNHPWVANVVRVQKLVPSRIEVELTYRRPVAMVEVKRGVYPVDAGGVLLPPGDFSFAQSKGYPLVRNARSTPQGPAGTNWGDAAVRGAAQLAGLLIDNWDRFGFAAISVIADGRATLSSDGTTYELITRGGSHILWGRSPDSTHPGELSAEQKMARLKEYRARYGGFDEPHGPYEIDIRHFQEITRHPITAGNWLRMRR